MASTETALRQNATAADWMHSDILGALFAARLDTVTTTDPIGAAVTAGPAGTPVLQFNPDYVFTPGPRDDRRAAPFAAARSAADWLYAPFAQVPNEWNGTPEWEVATEAIVNAHLIRVLGIEDWARLSSALDPRVLWRAYQQAARTQSGNAAKTLDYATFIGSAQVCAHALATSGVDLSDLPRTAVQRPLTNQARLAWRTLWVVPPRRNADPAWVLSALGATPPVPAEPSLTATVPYTEVYGPNLGLIVTELDRYVTELQASEISLVQGEVLLALLHASLPALQELRTEVVALSRHLSRSNWATLLMSDRQRDEFFMGVLQEARR